MRTPKNRVTVLGLGCMIIAAVVVALTPGEGAGATGQTEGSANALQASGDEIFFGGYRTVEGIQAFLDRQVAMHPTLAEKVDFGDSWCKKHAPCAQPEPGYDGYDMLALHITNRAIPGSKPVFWLTRLHPEEIVPPELAMRFISYLLDNYDSKRRRALAGGLSRYLGRAHG